MTNTTAVGIIGLGLVGKALASRFMVAGREVLGHDIDADAALTARAIGVDVVSDVRALASRCATLVLSLPNPQAVDSVLWAAHGIGHVCAAGSIVLDTTTTDPDETKSHAARLAEQGIRFVDVSLVGASDAIGAGNALALVGDTEAGALSYFSLLEIISNSRFFLGEIGAGNSAKLAVNLVLGLHRAVLAEGLALGKKSGLDPAQLLTILKQSAAYSRVMDIKGKRMLDGDYAPVARLSQHAKDVDLILAAAERHGSMAPLTAVHAAILVRAISAGWGGLDNSAVMKVYEELG